MPLDLHPLNPRIAHPASQMVWQAAVTSVPISVPIGKVEQRVFGGQGALFYSSLVKQLTSRYVHVVILSEVPDSSFVL